jgi:hypothetical protein
MISSNPRLKASAVTGQVLGCHGSAKLVGEPRIDLDRFNIAAVLNEQPSARRCPTDLNNDVCRERRYRVDDSVRDALVGEKVLLRLFFAFIKRPLAGLIVVTR